MRRGLVPDLRRATFELLGKAREIAEHTRSEVAAILIGSGDVEDVKALAAYGADKVLLMNDPSLGHPTSIASTSTLAQAIVSRESLRRPLSIHR